MLISWTLVHRNHWETLDVLLAALGEQLRSLEMSSAMISFQDGSGTIAARAIWGKPRLRPTRTCQPSEPRSRDKSAGKDTGRT